MTATTLRLDTDGISEDDACVVVAAWISCLDGDRAQKAAAFGLTPDSLETACIALDVAFHRGALALVEWAWIYALVEAWALISAPLGDSSPEEFHMAAALLAPCLPELPTVGSA